MTPDLSGPEAVLRAAIPDVAPAAQLVVRWRGRQIHAGAYGWLDPLTYQQPTQPDTLFDLASITKLFVVTTFMTLVEAGQVAIDQPVAEVLPEFTGRRKIAPYEDPLKPGTFVQLVTDADDVDVGLISFQQILTHTSGLPAWRPLFRQGNRNAARSMALGTAWAYQPGTRIVYSDIGLITLGVAIERLTGQTLDVAVAERVTAPAGLVHTRYLPIGGADGPAPQLVAPTEECAWRCRRVVGEVHDENAAALGGVAGHAGLFSTASDVAAFGQLLLDGGPPVLQPATVAEMTRVHAEWEGTRRGQGFALWSPDPEASSYPFSRRTFGHTGFTGTSLWVDPDRQLVVALLTDDVYYGRANRGIARLRLEVHRAIVETIDALPDSWVKTC